MAIAVTPKNVPISDIKLTSPAQLERAGHSHKVVNNALELGLELQMLINSPLPTNAKLALQHAAIKASIDVIFDEMVQQQLQLAKLIEQTELQNSNGTEINTSNQFDIPGEQPIIGESAPEDEPEITLVELEKVNEARQNYLRIINEYQQEYFRLRQMMLDNEAAQQNIKRSWNVLSTNTSIKVAGAVVNAIAVHNITIPAGIKVNQAAVAKGVSAVLVNRGADNFVKVKNTLQKMQAQITPEQKKQSLDIIPQVEAPAPEASTEEQAQYKAQVQQIETTQLLKYINDTSILLVGFLREELGLSVGDTLTMIKALNPVLKQHGADAVKQLQENGGQYEQLNNDLIGIKSEAKALYQKQQSVLNGQQPKATAVDTSYLHSLAGNSITAPTPTKTEPTFRKNLVEEEVAEKQQLEVPTNTSAAPAA